MYSIRFCDLLDLPIWCRQILFMQEHYRFHYKHATQKRTRKSCKMACMLARAKALSSCRALLINVSHCQPNIVLAQGIITTPTL